jgi:hypothetical protein
MRRFFRIHLSTGIVLMLLASVFLGANLYKGADGTNLYCGFPWAYRVNMIVITRHGMFRDGQSIGIELKPGDRIDTQKMNVAVQRIKNVQEYWHWRLAGNVCVAMAAMIAAAALLEWRLRSKPSRQHT